MSETVRERVPGGPISIGQLAALNDEIAALSRAGLPLERGMLDAGHDLPGRLRELMGGLAERMNQGESLSQAIEAHGDRFPRLYRAVVEAGLRGGRLSAALESLAEFVRGYIEARQAIGLALWYPLIVVMLAYGLFLMLMLTIAPRFEAAFAMLGVPSNWAMEGMAAMSRTAIYWGPIVPVLIVLGLAWWARSGSAAGFQPGRSWSLIRTFPWVRELVRQFEAANFAELLALLLDHGVPFHEAVKLASEATGDPRLVRASLALSGSLESGESARAALKGSRAFPPLLRWLLVSGAQQTQLVESLRNLGKIYQKRSLYQAEKIRVFLPTVMLLTVGATATLIFVLALFLPFASLLRGLAIPVN